MLMNIQVLIELKEYIDMYNYLYDALEVRSGAVGEPMDEMISKGDKDIYKLFNINYKIDKLLISLTEDVRDSICVAGLECNDYTDWSNQLKYNPMLFTGLYEAINDAHIVLEKYLDEEFREYKILTQPAYNQEIFKELSESSAAERGME